MSIDYVQIPAPLFESKEFHSLSWGNQKFLICLYRLFHDCETFTIELKKPEDYFQPSGMTLTRRVWDLLQSGVIEICGQQETIFKKRRRVFKFKDWENNDTNKI